MGRRLLLLLVTLSALPACVFTGLGSEQKLRDAVVGINDEMRWNRIDLAVQRVAPGYRPYFRASRLNWHRGFQIADTEIVHVEVTGEEQEDAISLVTVRWYDHANMILSETTLRQTWKKVIGGYILTEEEVASGNERLTELPEELRDAFEAAEAAQEEREAEAASVASRN